MQHVWERREAYSKVGGEREGKRPLGRPRLRILQVLRLYSLKSHARPARQ